ncbi:hypothetical protein BC628DRAFT_954905 [Trametes gibbosa]|nr:hypothetical protein BC628DRAFT_954905 [Trametes gibbosa]
MTRSFVCRSRPTRPSTMAIHLLCMAAGGQVCGRRRAERPAQRNGADSGGMDIRPSGVQFEYSCSALTPGPRTTTAQRKYHAHPWQALSTLLHLATLAESTSSLCAAPTLPQSFSNTTMGPDTAPPCRSCAAPCSIVSSICFSLANSYRPGLTIIRAVGASSVLCAHALILLQAMRPTCSTRGKSVVHCPSSAPYSA